MKKSLLLALFSLVSTASTWAYEIGDYAYTQSQRMKIIGENLIQNGNFASGSSGWFNANGTDTPNAESWSVESGLGPNGEAVMMSISASAGDNVTLTNRWKLDGGYYVFSFDIFGSSYTNTTTTAGNAQYVDLFTNTDGSFVKGEGATNVASTTYYSEEWHKVNFVVFMEAGSYLVFNAARLSEGTQMTNFELHAAASVYDVRIVEKRIALITKLLEEPSFNTEEAQDVKAEILDIIGFLNEEIAKGGLDDESTALAYMEEFETKVSEFLDASSQDLTSNEFFNYIESFTAMPKYNRKDIKGNTQYGGFMFRQEGATTGGETNWQHSNGAEVVALQIQTGYANKPGSVALYNTNLPAGKYFVSAEMRNAYCDKNYNLTWNLEGLVKAFVCSDTIECGTIVGEEYTMFYTIGEVKEGETFEAGFWWSDQLTGTEGSRFEIKNFQVRAFGDVLGPYNYSKAWNAFLTQYNAAVNGRKNVTSILGDKAYPWGQDSLQVALNTWDPYYDAIVAKGWVTADGEDAHLASTDELNDWALYQGVELYNEEGARLEYQLVRGYQNAYNYAISSNKVITDLANAIKAAENVLNDPINGEGDKATFQKVIDEAKAILDDVQQNTNDSRREADEARINEAIQALADATEVFKASGQIEPFISIDFANRFELVQPEEGDGYYVIKGIGGEMEFPSNSVDPDTNTGTTFGLGFDQEYLEMLRVGNYESKVQIAENQQATDEQILRVSFDVWFGKLSGKSLWVNLLNAEGQRVAGFYYEFYNNKINYNDFNNEAGTGFPLSSANLYDPKTVSNASIAADANRTTIELLVDNKYKAVQGILSGNKGTFTGEWVPFRTTIDDEGTLLEDTKITTFVLGSNYNNSDRRCWFDNLAMKKYASAATGPIDSGIRAVDTVKSDVRRHGIYNLQGVKMNSENLPAGLYIINGKKVVIQ